MVQQTVYSTLFFTSGTKVKINLSVLAMRPARVQTENPWRSHLLISTSHAVTKCMAKPRIHGTGNAESGKDRTWEVRTRCLPNQYCSANRWQRSDINERILFLISN